MSDAPTIHRTMTATEWGLLVALGALWGGSFFFTGIAVRELPTFTIVTLRVGLAALVLHAILLALGQPLPARRSAWLAFAGMAVLNNVIPFSLFTWGQAHIPSGLASILNATTPLFGAIVAHLLVPDEPLTRPRLAGVLLGLAGVVTMFGSDVLSGSPEHLVAELACLGAALSYAFSGVFGRRFAALKLTPLQTATGQVTMSTAFLLPVSTVVDRPWTLPMPGAETWGALAGLAVFSTVVGYILFFRILATAGATNLLLVTFLVPVSALILGVAFLSEALSVREVAGMALIGLGLACIDGRPLRAVAHRMRRSADGTSAANSHPSSNRTGNPEVSRMRGV